MIRGRVGQSADDELEPWLAVSVEHSNGELQQYEVIVDTGFTGFLILPEAVIKELGLVSEGYLQATLASGEAGRFEFYAAGVWWHEEVRRVEVFQSIDQSLLGMQLLRGSRVTVDAWDGGNVTIEEVPL